MEIHKWREEYQVYWHDTDMNGTMSFAALSRYLQDVAWKSAESLDFGFKRVSDLNMNWVLVRQLIKMNRLPKWGEKIKIETWPRGIDGLWAYRDYLIKNEKDEVLGGVTSSWMVIDAVSRRPQKLEFLNEALLDENIECVVGENAGKIVFNSSGKLIDSRSVRYSDLDLNGHVNNPKYVDWIMDALNQSGKLNEYFNFHINYISEARDKDEIKLYRSEETLENVLIKATNQKEKVIFIAELF